MIEHSINKNYISLIKNKNTNLINKLKCAKRNLQIAKYANTSKLSYNIKKIFNKNDETIQVKIINIIQNKNQKLLFILNSNDLLIYELKEEPFSLTLLKKILKTDIFINQNDMIKFFYCFKWQNGDIRFNFLSLKQIKLFAFNPEKIEFIMEKTKDYSNDNFNKYFYYMKKTNKFIIFKNDEVNVYDNSFSSKVNLIEPEDNIDNYESNDTIYSCKELSINLICVLYNHSISLYNLELDKDKLIGNIQEINTKYIKLINIKEQQYIMILSESDIYIYDFKKLNLTEKLDLGDIKNIKKIKYLSYSNIAIIYGNYNLAIFDLAYNLVKFKIINENHYEQIILKSRYFLKYLDENILFYNSTRNCFHFINYIKGQSLAKFSDGHNRIIRCKKIHFINMNEDNVNYKEKDKYFLIANIKGFYILIAKQ